MVLAVGLWMSLGAPAGSRAEDRAAGIAALGFDNVTSDSIGTRVAYENRRFRHSAYARGFLAHRLDDAAGITPGGSRLYFERRFGMVIAAVEEGAAGGDNADRGRAVPAAVRFPSDGDFPLPPAGRPRGDTRFATDLELGPRFAYELGRLYDPVVTRFELEPRLRVHPWPGARFTASFLIPLQNEFAPDSINPDIGRGRPGNITLEQFAWLPGVALLSGTAGVFSDNRYGLSVGTARPMFDGAVLLDAQADVTGYLAFPATGAEFSGIERFTGFAGLTWHLPGADAALRVRAARFVYGDNGAEVELRRGLGDLDVAFFYQRAAGLNASGIRFLIPIPPSVRRHATTHPPGLPVRFLPIDRLPVEYREESAPVGRLLKGVASREDYLRQMSRTGLAANAYRYRDARGWSPLPLGPPEIPRISLTGTTGFINTPWCAVMPDRGVEVGYNQIPKEAAYDNRGKHRNDVYYATLGYLPRIEAAIRWTFITGLKSFGDVVPDSKVTDSDRMLSGRVEVLSPRTDRPGLAVGFEDASGTRRFHSTYLVAGLPVERARLHARISLGYAPRLFEKVTRRTLDGAFGAIELSPWRPLAAALEYDTEKWNTSLAYAAPFGLRARVALLDMTHASFGAGWAFRL